MQCSALPRVLSNFAMKDFLDSPYPEKDRNIFLGPTLVLQKRSILLIALKDVPCPPKKEELHQLGHS